MKRLPHLLLTLLAAASLASCDYSRTPGKDPQDIEDFSDVPPATANETKRDSVNEKQNVQPPGGVGSAADQATSVDAGLEGAPNNANSPQQNMPAQTNTDSRESQRQN